MEHTKIIHLLNVPWTGLGLFQGFRGNRWLKNRIQIFKQFVIPSLQTQTNKNFILHCCWRREEKNNSHVKELIEYLKGIKEFKTIHTFHGILFWDDKYPDKIARNRLFMSLHNTMGELVNEIGECEYILMTIQPSDDVYHKETIQELQSIFEKNPSINAIGFQKGYILDYITKEVSEYNPLTSPPFYTIKFPREIFIDPLKHAQYTSLKVDVEKYKKGTPLPSHEYLKDVFQNSCTLPEERKFIVGCHGDNISTYYNHPYKGKKVDSAVLDNFGIKDILPLQLPFSLRRIIMRKLPYSIQRKLRYWAGEKEWILKPIFGIIYNLLRS